MARSQQDKAADLSALAGAEQTLRTQRENVRESLTIMQGSPTAAQQRQAIVRMMRLQLATVRFVLVLAGRSAAQDRSSEGES